KFPLPKHHSSFESQPYKFLSVNRLEDVKRIKAQIDIIFGLNQSGFDCSLDIVGDGSKEAFLKQYAKESIKRGYIRFLGSVPHHLLLERFRDYGAFISTSQCEGFGISVVEALACGL